MLVTSLEALTETDRKEIDMAELSYHDVARLLKADFETGKLYWLPRTPDIFSPGNQSAEKNCLRWNSRYADTEALASISHKGYKNGGIFRKFYAAHRVIWLLYAGEWPLGIDHINGRRDDNRIVNLRAVTNAENAKNKKKPNTNTSGVIGVSWDKMRQKWHAYIRTGGILINLGLFEVFEEAVLARKDAEIERGFHKNHGRAA